MKLFKNKAETLEDLSSIIKNAKILPQIRVTPEKYYNHFHDVIKRIRELNWINIPLIIRSCSLSEDSEIESLAGKYLSISNVLGEKDIKESIDRVISSFREEDGFVFIQPMLQNVSISGVAFSKDPNTGSDYIIINYDDISGSTSAVTSGGTNEIKTFYFFKEYNYPKDANMSKVIKLIRELESLMNTDRLDIEFAITDLGELYLFQVRPLIIRECVSITKDLHYQILKNIKDKITLISSRHPYLYGNKTVFGIMPDWNPAEIIGSRPRLLSMSLYKEIVTDNIWAYQRDNYGYKSLRSFPLMLSLGGIPYIDVRVSFNSFLPKSLEDDLCERLTNYYIDRLIRYPKYHDKVEFEIIFSCYTFDLCERIKDLKNYGFTNLDLLKISESLKILTNKIISKDGLWKSDILKIKKLEHRREKIIQSDLDKVSKIYWLVEDCKRYGTLPFAGLARAAFIAVQLLKSLLNIGIISESDYNNFINNLETISSNMSEDLEILNRKSFLKKYGHLRPGTYDILMSRYDEDPERYFDWEKLKEYHVKEKKSFTLSLKQLNKIQLLLNEHKLEYDVLGLFNFIKESIEGRELGKFIFTKNLSDALTLFKELGLEYGFSIEDCSYADISCIKKMYLSSGNIKDILEQSIEEGRKDYLQKTSINLPPLIISKEDVFYFYQELSEPNFVTLKNVIGKVVTIDGELDNLDQLEGNILFIPSADPGYDWIFSHDILAFVTMYGGINSHMAIRAGELSIPAIIGAGESLYKKWCSANNISIDCANRKVRVLK